MKNYSRQREEILDVIKKSNKSYFSAEDIYMHIKALDTGLSRSTVYRNLKLLVDEKIIEKTSTPVGPDKYALVKDKEYNVVCTECGKIMSFDYDIDLNELSSAVYNQTKINIPLNYLSFKGICDECKNKIK